MTQADEEFRQTSLDEAIGFDVGDPPALEAATPPEPEKPAEPEQQTEDQTEAPEGEAPTEAEPAATDAGSGGEDGGDEPLPEFMTAEYLEKHPDDAKNWKELKQQRNDFRGAVAQAQKFLEERDAQLKAMQARIDAMEAAQQRQQPERTPADPVEDPAGFRAEISSDVGDALLDLSETRARMEFGEERVEKAVAEFLKLPDNDPSKVAVYQVAPKDRWIGMVREMERRELAAEIGDDPAAYRNRLEKETEEKVRAKIAAEFEQSKQAEIEAALRERTGLPASVATAPGSGRTATPPPYEPAPVGALWSDSPLDR